MYDKCVFLFQAEDGIRYAQESRGLGDVYKRQGVNAACIHDKKIVPGPIAFRNQTVARGAGNVVNYCQTFAYQAIKQCAFTNIWPSDQNNYGFRPDFLS